MLIRLLAIGNKMPAWVTLGFKEYARRFSGACQLKLIELPLEKRTKQSDLSKIIEKESQRLLMAIHPDHRLVTLEVTGAAWSTRQLADKIKAWQTDSRNIDMVIGGPDGLSAELLKKAEARWSLSSLTLPHPIVRIIVAEQLYRALMILQNHPYHRE